MLLVGVLIGSAATTAPPAAPAPGDPASAAAAAAAAAEGERGGTKRPPRKPRSEGTKGDAGAKAAKGGQPAPRRTARPRASSEEATGSAGRKDGRRLRKKAPRNCPTKSPRPARRRRPTARLPGGGSGGRRSNERRRPESDLEQRRDRLARSSLELQWDLGGLAYEMAIRDHFRLDVLTRQAAKLQQVDAELAEVERMLRLDEAGAAGACGSCGALYARGSVFCWQCGKDLMDAAASGTAGGSDTAVHRAASLAVTDRRWAAPLAVALGFGLFLGVAIGPGAAGTLATGGPLIQVEVPSSSGGSEEVVTGGGGGPGGSSSAVQASPGPSASPTGVAELRGTRSGRSGRIRIAASGHDPARARNGRPSARRRKGARRAADARRRRRPRQPGRRQLCAGRKRRRPRRGARRQGAGGGDPGEGPRQAARQWDVRRGRQAGEDR